MPTRIHPSSRLYRELADDAGALPAGLLARVADAATADRSRRAAAMALLADPSVPQDVAARMHAWLTDPSMRPLSPNAANYGSDRADALWLLRSDPASLAQIEDWTARTVKFALEVLAHPSTPLSVLERLAKDPRPRVRAHVAAAPLCPPRLAIFIVSSSDTFIAQAIGTGPQARPGADEGVRAVYVAVAEVLPGLPGPVRSALAATLKTVALLPHTVHPDLPLPAKLRVAQLWLSTAADSRKTSARVAATRVTDDLLSGSTNRALLSAAADAWRHHDTSDLRPETYAQLEPYLAAEQLPDRPDGHLTDRPADALWKADAATLTALLDLVPTEHQGNAAYWRALEQVSDGFDGTLGELFTVVDSILAPPSRS